MTIKNKLENQKSALKQTN